MMTDETIENITSRHNTSRFPTPDEDSVLKGHFIAGRHKFGFLTIEQMKAAFLPHELAELFGLGFRIYLIEAEEAFKSPYQVIFNPKSVTMKKDISNLFAEVK